MIFLQYNSSFWLKSPTILTVTSTGRQQMGKHQTRDDSDDSASARSRRKD